MMMMTMSMLVLLTLTMQMLLLQLCLCVAAPAAAAAVQQLIVWLVADLLLQQQLMCCHSFWLYSQQHYCFDHSISSATWPAAAAAVLDYKRLCFAESSAL
jgi:hypothetical protein